MQILETNVQEEQDSLNIDQSLSIVQNVESI